jgi:hypothetical protein
VGLLLYDALVLAKTSSVLKHTRNVLTLGVPTLNFRPEDFRAQLGQYPELATRYSGLEFHDHLGFFKGLGFSVVDAMDISDYEGANILGDLNDPLLREKVSDSYDLIYDSGTIEHIFDAPTALRTLVHLAAIGGAVVHASPANGFMDHGLWQLSPDLFRTFYRSAGFTILTSAAFVFADLPYALRTDENMYRRHGRKYVVRNFPEAIAVFAARKETDAGFVGIRMQDYYNTMHGSEHSNDESSFFLEFGSHDPDQHDESQSMRPSLKESMSRLARFCRRMIG